MKRGHAAAIAGIERDIELRTRLAANLERFVREVAAPEHMRDASPCRLWTRATNGRKGYGLISVGAGKNKLAHRVAFELQHGPTPAGMLVRHKCDRPLCTNVEHLELGTHADNTQDSIKRGRQSKGAKHRAAMAGKACAGARHYRATLSDSEVAYLRRLRSAEFSIKSIAAHTGIKPRTASALIAGDNRATASASPWSLPGDAEALLRLRRLRAGDLQTLPAERRHIERAAAAALARAELPL